MNMQGNLLFIRVGCVHPKISSIIKKILLIGFINTYNFNELSPFIHNCFMSYLDHVQNIVVKRKRLSFLIFSTKNVRFLHVYQRFQGEKNINLRFLKYLITKL